MGSKEPPVAKPTSTSSTGFNCSSGEEQREACKGLPKFGAYEGQPYCVLHYPAKNKLMEFKEAISRKLEAEDFNFEGVWFPERTSFTIPFTKKANFANAIFIDDVDFSEATFVNTVDFTSSTFHGAVQFNNVEFWDTAIFYSCRFLKNADFLDATFHQKADFRCSEFRSEANFQTTFKRDVDFIYGFFRGEAYFRYVTFNGSVNFRSATFNDYLRFGGKQLSQEAAFDFQNARIDKPDRVTFDSLALRPYWFVNVNARKFDFLNVDWQWKTLTIKSEVCELGKKQVADAHRLLAVAFRNLAFNAEENERFGEASQFRYLAWQVWRKNEPHDYLTALIAWLYWAASGYGERILRACIVLLAIWLFFATLYSLGTNYTRVGFGSETTQFSLAKWVNENGNPPPAPLPSMKSLIYSLNTMTLQKPDPKPITSAAKGLVLVETIVGPIQAALLVLAIRRKFMR
jgi:uncharacterized protein YjbI with pentapeptide repeats